MKLFNQTIKALLIVLPALFFVNTSAKNTSTEQLDTNTPVLRATFLSESFRMNNYFGDKLHQADFKLDSMYRNKWDSETDKWKLNDFSTFEQDNKGRDSIIIFTDGYTKDTKMTFKYDDAGNNTEISYFRFCEAGWAIIEKHLYTYDEHGNETAELTQYSTFNTTPDDTTYTSVGKNKHEYVYDANNHVIEKAFFIFDRSSKSYYITSKTNYTVSQTGRILESINQHSKDLRGPISLSSSSTYEYFDELNKEESIFSTWNKTTEKMEVSSKTITLFNENQQTTEEINYAYNADSSSWTERSKTQYTYCENGNLTEEEYSQWNDSTKQWKTTNKEVFYYSAASSTTAISHNSLITDTDKLQLYPNPATTHVTIQSKATIGGLFTVEINDTNGKTVFKNIYSDTKIAACNIQLPKLAKGLYILQVKGANIKQSTKLMIK